MTCTSNGQELIQKDNSMTTKFLIRMAVVALIVGMLGGAYLIVSRNNVGAVPIGGDTPSGFLH